MRELHWKSKTEDQIPFGGHPWFIADDMMAKGENIFNLNWAESEHFSSTALAHLFGLAFPWVPSAVRLEFTSVTVVELSNEKGTLTFPTLTLLNDAKHLDGLEIENIFGR